MKRLLPTCGALLLLVLLPTGHAAQLTLPEHLAIDAINGQEVSGGLLKRVRSYTLPDGPVWVELHYTDMQPSELGDSHTNFKSAPVAVGFVAAPGQNYRVEAERPANEKQAALFARAPRLVVVEAGGGAVAQQFLNAVELKQKRLQATQTPLATALPAAPATPATAVVPVAPAAAGTPSAPAGGNLAADNLWFWWQQADEPTRQAFLRRIGRQAN